MQQEVTLSTQQVMVELGIVNVRNVQLLAQKGRLEKIILPRKPGTPGKPPCCYTAESVEAEKQRRLTGTKYIPQGYPLGYPQPQRATGLSAMIEETNHAHANLVDRQAEVFGGLATLCATLSAQLPQLPQKAAAADPPDDAYLTIAEAAAVKRMPTSWVKAQLENGRLPFEMTARNGKRILRGDLRNLPSRSTEPADGEQRAKADRVLGPIL